MMKHKSEIIKTPIRPTAYILICVPASGKSTWIKNFYSSNPTVVLSTDNYIEAVAQCDGMTYSEAFNDNIGEATSSMMDDLEYAKSIKSDIIWDQTNCNTKARARKIRLLDGYHKVAVVFMTPDSVELDRRLKSRPGKHIPCSVMDSMIASFVAPTVDEGFDEIYYGSEFNGEKK